MIVLSWATLRVFSAPSSQRKFAPRWSCAGTFLFLGCIDSYSVQIKQIALKVREDYRGRARAFSSISPTHILASDPAKVKAEVRSKIEHPRTAGAL